MKLAALAAASMVLGSSCGLFTLQEPYERWNVIIAYHDEDGRVFAEPSRVVVNGPRGEIRIDNVTREDRGFQIEDLGIAVELDNNQSANIDVTGVQDGETYAFIDHKNRDGPRGTLVVDYVRQDE